MSRALVTSVAVLALAGLFFVFFQSAKQVPFLEGVNPFADDPYDAVGSFAIQAAGALALLSVVRALGFLTSGDRASLLARTQLASVLCVAITLAADAIAMARHADVWWAKPGGTALAVMIVALACLTAAVGIVCARPPARSWSALPVAVCVAAALGLFLYPEATRSSLAGAFAAIAAGIVVLFVPLRVLVTALVAREAPPRRRRFPVEWALVLIVALAIGLGLATAEAGSEGGLRPGVIFIFIGFEAAAVLFGYAVMRRPLELTL